MKAIRFIIVASSIVALPACSGSSNEQARIDSTLVITVSIPNSSPDQTSPSSEVTRLPSPTDGHLTASTPTSDFSLLEQYPDVQQVYSALNSFLGGRVWYSKDAHLHNIDLNGDAKDDLVYFDLDGYAMIWLGSRFSEPVPLYKRISGNSESNTRLMFEDLTGDEVPEIVFDSVQIYHWGTGLGSATWDRRIYHCNDQTCKEAIYFVLDDYTTDDNFGGICRSHGIVSFNPQDRLLRYFSEGFSIYGCGEFNVDPATIVPVLRVKPSTVTYYEWSNNEFKGVLTEIAALESNIENQSRLFDERSDGTLARITAQFNMGAVSQNDICQLYISDTEVGNKFGCKSNFTQVEWKDITGDSEEELVVITFSGSTEYDLEGNDLGSLMCAHQHLLAYKLEAEGPRKIADIKGCTIESDLYGVRLTDVDGDGSLEIMAAGYPLDFYWSAERNPDCENGLVFEDNGSVQTCAFFPFDHDVSIYGWNGHEYWPVQ